MSAEQKSRTRVLHVSFYRDPDLNNIAWRMLEALGHGKEGGGSSYENIPLYLFSRAGEADAGQGDGICLRAEPRDLRGLRLAALATRLRESLSQPMDVTIVHRMRAALLVERALGDARGSGLVVVHGRNTLRGSRRRRQVLKRLLPHWHFAAISGAVRADLEARGIPSERIVDLPNALDVEAVRARLLPAPEARAALRLPAVPFRFGALTRLEPKKGVHTLLAACAALPREIHLSILGAGPERDVLQQAIVRERVGERVQLHGHVSEGYRYLQAFDALVHPSHEEGFGMVLLEAMAAERPIVATSAGGIPEVLGSSVPLVAPGDAGALAAAMAAMAARSEAERAALGSSLLRRARAHFDLPAAQQSIRDVVDQLAGGDVPG